MSQLRFLSVCSGIEAASVAWKPLGWTAAGFSEIERFPSEVLAHHYGSNMPGEPLTTNGVPNFGDFTTIPIGEHSPLGRVDLLCGGTPCQAFSIAGKRLSLADARGNLSLAFAVLAHELARSHGTRAALWENVPGVLSTDDNAFGCFLAALVGCDDPVLPCARPRSGQSNAFWRWFKAGKRPVLDDDGNETDEFIERPAGHRIKWPDAGMVAGPRARAAWIVRDAQYFGLAQRRRRVFLVVDLGNGPDPVAVLFESQGLRGNPAPRREAGQDIAETISASAGKRGGVNEGERNGLVCADLAPTLNAAFGQKLGLENQHIDQGAPLFVAEPIAFSSKDYGADASLNLAPTLRAGGHAGSHANAGVGRAIAFKPAHFTRGKDGAPSIVCPPLTAEADKGDQDPLLLTRDHAAENWAVRRLTPRECERLQGFPDDYTAIPRGGKLVSECADGPRYKALGNSWAVPVVHWIGARIAANWPRIDDE